ncbi:hypothetical protein D8M06_00575 [Oceanobacillus halophilus]|uniref:Uncharacterized protein n=1 Tax=Oceanobacillus halophilus TaxID=930130 RepID=A0A495ABR0_9BACI|nr:hypothetical protein D8M06_00575 [Oceanobacillus halophilus]
MLFFIKFSHLSALGVKEEYLYFILIFLSAILIYFIVKPFVQWFVTLRSTRLLSYIVSSLLAISLFFVVVLLVPDITSLLFILLEMLMQVLALFGLSLILYYGFKRFSGKT